MATIRITCPACGKALEVDADAAGKEVECGECLEVFVAKAPESKIRGTPATGGKIPAARPGSKSASKAARRRRDDEEDDEDDDDYDPRPSRRGRAGYGTQKSRLAYIILALFLGSLGVHNFYAGRTGQGVSQLILTMVSIPLMCVFFVGVVTIWIPIIWAIVDVIVVTKDGNSVPMI